MHGFFVFIRVAPARSRSQRGSRRVEGNVPAADDHDPLAQIYLESLVDIQEVLDCTQHTVELVTGEIPKMA